MISEQNIATLIGGNVTDSDGHKIGPVGQIYVDPDTGRPNWAVGSHWGGREPTIREVVPQRELPLPDVAPPPALVDLVYPRVLSCIDATVRREL